MEKCVFYQTERSVWFCKHKDWERYRFENNINPQRMLLWDITREAIEQLLYILENDKEMFIKIIQEELD